ncbi:MAG: DUF805 domain-containing protein [Gammaproteobacteria bacterium]
MSTAYDTPLSDVTKTGSTFNPPLWSAKGRMGRLRYLGHTAWTTILIMLIGVIGAVAMGLEEGPSFDMVLGVLGLATLIIRVVFAIKRVHDIEWPGISAAICVIPLINLLLVFWPGTKGANRYGPPPGPNNGLIIAGALLLPLVFIGGMMAAIAVPAYNDYTARAQVGEAFVMTSSAKMTLVQHYQTSAAWPDENTLADLGLDQTIRGKYAAMSVEADTGVINCRMHADGSVASSVAGGTIRFRPVVTDSFTFQCSSPDIGPRFLPNSCRGQDARD